eukprot:gnl/TRDRNA2_/TRDRNA2_124561_c1_seq1.p1 gnl/TRDRNA2_/TRDRNA2_124561_c1~~gnl/TRDRNA2_/TRDRNA2_124561_c1_seq1.p1  ORF type:complete len:268 (+),score=50.12 gnl/TRDRNA2_/TRDRNA2_124561_c1_seq1:80-805(+)
MPEKDLSIGLKRNICTYLASGTYIAHFDDDDFYGPDYLVKMIQAMDDQKSDAITLSGWYIMDRDTGRFGYADPLKKFRNGMQTMRNKYITDDMLFGYGFSYVYKRKAAMQDPFLDMNHCEDIKFYNSIRSRNFLWKMRHRKKQGLSTPNMPPPLDPSGIALYHDTEGICVHTEHARSTSNYADQEDVAAEQLDALKTIVRSCTNEDESEDDCPSSVSSDIAPPAFAPALVAALSPAIFAQG